MKKRNPNHSKSITEKHEMFSAPTLNPIVVFPGHELTEALETAREFVLGSPKDILTQVSLEEALEGEPVFYDEKIQTYTLHILPQIQQIFHYLDTNERIIIPVIRSFEQNNKFISFIPLSDKYSRIRYTYHNSFNYHSLIFASDLENINSILYEYYWKYLYTVLTSGSTAGIQVSYKSGETILQTIEITQDVLVLPIYYFVYDLTTQLYNSTLDNNNLQSIRDKILEKLQLANKLGIVDLNLLIMLALSISKFVYYHDAEVLSSGGLPLYSGENIENIVRKIYAESSFPRIKLEKYAEILVSLLKNKDTIPMHMYSILLQIGMLGIHKIDKNTQNILVK